MATPKTPLWKCEPHTAAKHIILRRYLEAWFPILGGTNPRIVYVDGFAGPGEYVDGAPGSPQIALDVAISQKAHIKGEVVFFFVEADESRSEHLTALVESRKATGLPSRFHIEVRNGEFESEFRGLLDDVERSGLGMAPTFAFIDPFGWKGLPMTLVHHLLTHERTEAFINFSIDAVNRFAEHPKEQFRDQITDLFGTSAVVDVARKSSNRFNDLRILYEQQLRRSASYVRFFTMCGFDGKPIYDLFFATNNILGLEKMKDAMWQADPDGTFRFSDATDANQQVLFEHASFELEKLESLLLTTFANRKSVVVQDLVTWVVGDTPYLQTHLRKALFALEAQGWLHVHPLKTDGKKRKAGTYAPSVLLDFRTKPMRSPVQGGLF